MKLAFVILIVIAVFLTMCQAGAGTGTLESRRGEFTALTSITCEHVTNIDCNRSSP